MNTSLLMRDTAIVAQTPAADYSSKEGYLVDLANGTATVSASATVVSKGVILAGNLTAANYANERVSVGILGGMAGTIRMRAGGTIVAGAKVQQGTDGTVVTYASGARVEVGVALESGVAGENIEVAPLTPVYYAS